MTVVWQFYWPVFAAAAIFGLVAGTADLRRVRGKRQFTWLAKGAAISLLIGFAWHSLGGAADRMSRSVERSARLTLDNYEMQPVSARLARSPIRRVLILSGPGNDFQQRELVRIMSEVPGVAGARWDRPIQRRSL